VVFLGGWLARLADIATINLVMEIVVAFVGSAILLVVFHALAHRGLLHA
jgi:uncharacterized membrane protein YeaQ/YmgE (transglycosylase-associated protein family)